MEVALASTVLALTLVGMIGVIESGSQMLDLSRKQMMAAQILHGEIDQLRMQSWPTVSGYTEAGLTSTSFGYGASTTLTAANDPSYATFIAEYPNAANIFALTRSVSCLQPSQANNNGTGSFYAAAPKLLMVTFTIQWTGVTGRRYTRVSSTYVGLNGLYVAFQRS